MLAEANEVYIQSNKGLNKLIVGTSALELNKLMWGGYGLEVYIDLPELDKVKVGNVTLEHNHFSDGEFCSLIDKENRLWLPTPERAIVDTIYFLNENYIEGPLIESLQNYLDKQEDLSKLYEVADFYKVPRETIDYWVNEAKEESDMSMG